MDELEAFAEKIIAENKANGTWIEETPAVETTVATEETKPTETITETTSTETKVEETTTPKSVIDVLSSLNTEVKEEKVIELPEDIKARLALADKYEAFAKSDIAQLLETDLTPIELLSSINMIDYSKMSAEQLIIENAKIIAGDRFTDELAEEAIEAYNNLPTTLDKIELEKKLVEKLGQNKVDIKNELVKKIQDHQEAKKANQPIPVDYKKIEQEEKGKLEKTLDILVNQHGLDTEIANQIKSTYNIQLAGAFVDDKNQFNENEFIKAAYKMVAYDKDIQKLKDDFATQILEAEKRAYEKAKKEFGNPELAQTGLTESAISFEEIYKDAIKNS